MAPMKTFLTALCLLVFVVSGFSQNNKPQTATPCTLTVNESPTVRSLKLGQNISALEEILADEDPALKRLAFYATSADELGRTRNHIYNSPLYKSEKLKGIDAIELVYLDGRLASFQIRYGRGVRWQSSLHFAAAIAEQLNLPTKGWIDTVSPKLTCQGFFVEVFAVDAMSTLRVERVDLSAELNSRRSQLERKRRTEFRP